MEAAVHLHLREQQVRHGHVGGEGGRQHRLLQERRLHPGTQSENLVVLCERGGPGPPLQHLCAAAGPNGPRL